MKVVTVSIVLLLSWLAESSLAQTDTPTLTPTPTPTPCCVVDSTGDDGDNNPGNGDCDDGTGACTLRAAIEEANTSPGTTIRFAIPAGTDPGCDSGSGVCTITPGTLLPDIAAVTTIDGTTQSGASCGDLWSSDAPEWKVKIEGDGSLERGLTLGSDDVTIRGLWIAGFDGEGDYGIRCYGDREIIKCNYLDGNSTGISISEADAVVGGLAAGDGNLFGGPSPVGDSSGITLYSTSMGALIAGNFVGTNAAGTSARPHAVGINVDGADGVTIQSNLVSGNSTIGIMVSKGPNGFYSDNDLILSNYVGTDITGDSPLGNGVGIYAGYENNLTIGGSDPEDRNIISANQSYGIVIGEQFQGYAGPATIEGYYIGTNSSGVTGGMCNGIAQIRNYGYSTTISDNTIGACSAPLGCCAYSGDNAISATCADSVAAGRPWDSEAAEGLEEYVGEPLWCNPEATCNVEGSFWSDCPPIDCRYVVADARTEGMTIAADIDPFPEFAVCLDTLFGDTLTVASWDAPGFVGAISEDPNNAVLRYVNFGVLLNWDTGAFSLDPNDPNDTIIAAWLRTQTQQVYSQGEKRLKADWYDWSAPDPNELCDATDHDPNSPEDALSVNGRCGADCLLANIPQAPGPVGSTWKQHDFELDNPQTNIDLDGQTYLRMQIADEPGMSVDLFSFGRTWPTPTPGARPGPQLVMLVCNPTVVPECGDGVVDPPFETCDDDNTSNGDGCSSSCRVEVATPTATPTFIPTPTVPPACTPIEIEADAEWNAVGQSYSGPPTYAACYEGGSPTAGLSFIGSGHFPNSEGYLDWIDLLRWNTSTITVPMGTTLSRAWLRLAVTSAYSRGRKSFEADWHDWSATCEVTDYDPGSPRDALSSDGTCGRQCVIKYIFPPFMFDGPIDQDFELEGFATNVDLEGYTYLRLFARDETGADPIINRDAVEAVSKTPADPNDPLPATRLVLLFCPEP